MKRGVFAWKTDTVRKNLFAKNATKLTALTQCTIHPHKITLVNSRAIIQVLKTTRASALRTQGLNVANVNICHVKPKLDEIKLLLNSSFKLDILGLCKTFLDENTKDNILHMQSFNLERKDRAAFKQATLNTKLGGGVVVYEPRQANLCLRAFRDDKL